MGIRRHREPEPIVHTEQIIQRLLVHHYYSACKYLVPNIHYQLGEADLLIVRRSGYAEEFEIKTNTADLKADLRKVRKHAQFQSRFNNTHTTKYAIPNKISYVIGPDVNYSTFEFPDYAGLCIANRGLEWIIIPKFVHKVKYDWSKKIASSCSFRLLKALELSTYGD